MTKRDTPTAVRAKEEMMDDQEMLITALLALLGAQTIDLAEGTYVPVKPLARALGLDWPATCLALADDGGGLDLAVVRRNQRGGARAVPLICLHLLDVSEWLATVDPSQVRSEIAGRVRQFQAQYERTLDEEFNAQRSTRPVATLSCETMVETPEEREAKNAEQSRQVAAWKEKWARLMEELAAVDYRDEAKLAELVELSTL